MFVAAPTLSNRIQRTRNSVRRLHLLHWLCKHATSGKRTLKNIGVALEEKIKELSDGLIERRRAFMDQATISIEITAFQILDDVANISTQLRYLSSQVSGAGR